MSSESLSIEGALARLHSLQVSFQIGSDHLPDDRVLTEAEVRQRVSQANAPLWDELIGQPQYLNERMVNPDEVISFMRGLAQQPEEQLIRMRLAPFDLASPGLRLHYQDGFGTHGLARRWRIEGLLSSRNLVPAIDLDDARADFARAAQEEKARQVAFKQLSKQLAETPKTAPKYDAIAREQRLVGERLLAVATVALHGGERLLAALPADAPERTGIQADVERLRTLRPPSGPHGARPWGHRPYP